MPDLQNRLTALLQELPKDVSLVAVSKFHEASKIQEAYAAGQRVFGESRVQELEEKHRQLPKDIEWHFIGHLQLNKVKYIAPYVSLIHAVDSERLLSEIHRQAARCGRTIPCLLQLHVAQETTKFGFTPEECEKFLHNGSWKDYPNAHICGIMCMASNTDDDEQVRAEFSKAYQFFKMAQAQFFANDPDFKIRSWGMSGDYHTAIQEGSNMVRIGSHIFGEREY